MKEIVKQIGDSKLLLSVPISIYEIEAILNTTYKFTDKCYINLDQIDTEIEIYFISKNDNINLNDLVLEFGNELIDQQVRLNTGREYKNIRDELVKKAFASVSK